MERTGKIVGINLLIFVAYTLLIHATSGRDAPIEGSILAYVHAGGIFVVGLLMAIFNKDEKRAMGVGLILAGLLIVIIGFSVCIGTLDLSFH